MEHIHVDIVVMPPFQGYRYYLICVDRFIRLPTVARALDSNWIRRFGSPLYMTTHQSRNFESHLFKHLNSLLDTTYLRTTLYHLAVNGMLERFHRQLKAAVKFHESDRWTSVLSTVLLGIPSAWKEDIQATAAEMVYGQYLRLPGEFFHPA